MARDLEGDLQRAIQSGEFALADSLIRQYRDYVHGELASAESLDSRLRIIQESKQLLEDSLHLARVIRAHMAAKLRTIKSVSIYQGQQDSGGRWSVRG